jgi:hypothetical protein
MRNHVAYIAVGLGLSLLSTTYLAAQQGAPQKSPVSSLAANVTKRIQSTLELIASRSPVPTAVTGKPYSLVQTQKTKLFGLDGSIVLIEQIVTKYMRYSEGREREETYVNDNFSRPLAVTITDPILHRRLFITPDLHLVKVLHPRDYIPATEAEKQKQKGHRTKEPLPSKTILGVKTVGERIINTGAVSSVSGKPSYQFTIDSWLAPDLGIVLESHSATKGGVDDTTMETTSITYVAPDSSLFEVPTGYTVVDVPGNSGTGK